MTWGMTWCNLAKGMAPVLQSGEQYTELDTRQWIKDTFMF